MRILHVIARVLGLYRSTQPTVSSTFLSLNLYFLDEVHVIYTDEIEGVLLGVFVGYFFNFPRNLANWGEAPFNQISERKNFRNAIVVNATAKKPSKRTSTAERRNVSDREGSVSVGGGGISSVSDSLESFI